jgi:microcystin-dependent protein
MSVEIDGTTGITTPQINAGNIVGEVGFFARNTAPEGWLKANGAAVSRTTYSDLFAEIGTTYGAGDGSTTFELPDMRGEFPRGWDDGRGVDSGRSFGTAQLDQMQRITGKTGLVWQRDSDTAGAISTDATAANRDRDSAPGVNSSRQDIFFDSANSPDARTSATTAGETRARNVALLACIKF